MADVNTLLAKMSEHGGNALHLIVGEPPKMRVEGTMSALEPEPIDSDTMEAMLEYVCPPRSWLGFLEEHDLDFAYDIPGHARYRANYFYNHWGPGAVFKLIPNKVITMEQLGLPPVLERICAARSGLILVTGPMGSGTSTTIAAMIDHINETSQKLIIAIEDPIEFVHGAKKGIVVHREIGQHSQSFPEALRGAMRADPDIVFVGDVSDPETLRLALTCASMGILVFATMHTPNATRTLNHVIASFSLDEQPLIRTMLADCLTAVVSQLLCEKVDGGMVAANEVLLGNDTLSETIRHGKLSKISSIIDAYESEGMCSMNSKLKKLVADEVISGEEAYRKSVDKKLFRHLLDQDGPLQRL